MPLSLRVVSAHMGQALIIAASNLSKYFIIHKKFATIFNETFYKNQTIFHILSQIGGGYFVNYQYVTQSLIIIFKIF